MNNEDVEFWTAEAMMREGGGFVRRLGAAYRYADPDNRRKIREAFPEYWRRYEDRGRQLWADEYCQARQEAASGAARTDPE